MNAPTYVHPHVRELSLHYYYGPDGANTIAHARCAPEGAEYVARVNTSHAARRDDRTMSCGPCGSTVTVLPHRSAPIVRHAERLLASVFGPLGPVNASEAWHAAMKCDGPSLYEAYELLWREASAWDAPNLPDYLRNTGGPREWTHAVSDYVDRHSIR